MCVRQRGNIYLPDVLYHDRAPIISALSKRSRALQIIDRAGNKQSPRMAAVQHPARIDMRNAGNRHVVWQK